MGFCSMAVQESETPLIFGVWSMSCLGRVEAELGLADGAPFPVIEPDNGEIWPMRDVLPAHVCPDPPFCTHTASYMNTHRHTESEELHS